MRPLSVLLSSILLLTIAHAQNTPNPIRLCVSMPKNTSRLHTVNPKWQRIQLVKSFERINKSKDVTKGKSARIETVSLDSTDEADPEVRENHCEFVLHTNLTDALRTDAGRVSVPPPDAVELGRIGIGDPRASPRDSNDATVTYRIVRNGNPQNWSSGIVSAKDSLQDEALVAQLMDQIAKRVATELRQPHAPAPQ